MDRKTTRNYLRLPALVGGLLVLAIVGGCKTEDGPSPHDRQNQALKDPFAYGPDASLMNGPKKDEVDPTDISGGDVGTLNKKAMKRDLESVFGP